MARWRSMLPNFNWLPKSIWSLAAILLLAALVGAGGMLFTVEFNKHTATTKFCTSCHSMAVMTEDPHYQKSAHIANSAGVQVNCGTCHIPTNNIFQETWVHATSGIRDLISEATTDFSDKPAWEAKRRELAKGVRKHMLGWRNQTCTTCHVPASIKPASQTGQVIHAALPEDMACAACHRNIVHSRPGPVPAADEIKMIKRAAEDWVHSRSLANKHAQRGIGCSSCHGNELIAEPNAAPANAQCMGCHGDLKTVAQNFKGPQDRNVHASVENVPCGTCHTVHETKSAEAKPK